MPLCMATDADMFALAAAIKALPTKYNDSPGDSWEFRYSWRAQRAEVLSDDGTVLATWVTGESGELVELFRSALHGSDGFGFLAAPVPVVKKGKMAKHRFKTSVEIVAHKLHGSIGLQFVRTDLQSLVGKKSRKTKEKCDFTGDVLFEDEQLPTAQSKAVELLGRSCDLSKVEKDEKRNAITFTFCGSLDGYCNNGERRHVRAFTKTTEEIEGVCSGMAKKLRVVFAGKWRDPMPLDDQSIGQSCYKDMKKYLEGVIGAKKKDDALAAKAQRSAQQRQKLEARNVQKGGFASLPNDSWAKRAVDAFGLQTSTFDASVSEDEWKRYFSLRCRMQAGFEQMAAQEEEEDDDSGSEGYDTGMGKVESMRKRLSLTLRIRADFARALRSGGVPEEVTEAVTRGLFLQHFNVCEDGDIHPRTVEIKVLIFALAANARAVALEYQSHHRERMYGLEKFAFVNATIYGAGVSVPEKPHEPEMCVLYNLETAGKEDREKARLGANGMIKKLAIATFGSNLKLSTRKAFAAFLRAAGVDVEPASSIPYYSGNDPISLYRRSHACVAKDIETDAELDREPSKSKKRASSPPNQPAVKYTKIEALSVAGA